MLDIIKAIFILLFTLTGVLIGNHLTLVNREFWSEQLGEFVGATPTLALSSVFGLTGYLIASLIWREFQMRVIDKFDKFNSVSIFYSVAGFFSGLAVANIIIILPVYFFVSGNRSFFYDNLKDYDIIMKLAPLYYISIPIILNLFFGYFGAKILYNYKSRPAFVVNNKIIDTSVLIDKRIYELVKSGFIEGKLLIPGFVLSELQYMADLDDSAKRNRSRMALNLLEKMKLEFSDIVSVNNTEIDGIYKEVDDKLLFMAKEFNATLVTVDYNLSKIAQVKGIKVLNINELELILKTSILPGEQIDIEIIKKGKNKDQGIGYLKDGTMVVVEKGAVSQGEFVKVNVTKVLQTSAGKMVFATLI